MIKFQKFFGKQTSKVSQLWNQAPCIICKRIKQIHLQRLNNLDMMNKSYQILQNIKSAYTAIKQKYPLNYQKKVEHYLSFHHLILTKEGSMLSQQKATFRLVLVIISTNSLQNRSIYTRLVCQIVYQYLSESKSIARNAFRECGDNSIDKV